MQSQPRILVIRGGAIGDFILTLPAIGALRERWPDAHIEILGYSHIVELAVGPQHAQKTRSIEYGPMSAFFVPHGELNQELADYFASFNVVVSYLYDPDKMFEDNLRRAGVKHLVVGSPHPTHLPAAAHLAKPLESLAIYVDSPQPRVHPSPADLKFGREFLGSPSDVWVAVHCGSGSPKKNWPVGFFAEICQWLSLAFGSKLVVICGEADGTVTAEFLQQTRGIVSREARGLSLVRLAGVLANCHLYLGNDSGITHLAAAVGIPTVALWWPGSSPIWRPTGSNVRVIPFNQASPDFVREEVEKLLKKR